MFKEMDYYELFQTLGSAVIFGGLMFFVFTEVLSVAFWIMVIGLSLFLCGTE